MNKYSHLTITSLFVASLLITGGAVVGCGGDDDDNGETKDNGSGGTSSSNGSGGKGGSTSSSTGNAGSSAAAACTTTTTCGGQTCDVGSASSGLASQYSMLTAMQGGVCYNACCATGDVCGAKLKFTGTATMLIGLIGGSAEGNCVATNQAGSLNSACPNSLGSGDEDAGTTTTQAGAAGLQQALGQMFDYKGCCRPDSKCGLDLGEIGLGCVANEEIGQINSMFSNFSPTAKSCNK